MNQRQAHGLALVAILLWSTLASFAALRPAGDPLLTTGIGLCIGGALSLPRWRSWLVPWRTWAVGCAGLFGYHALYFTAFTRAPALEVNVLNYLWPVLMIAFAPFILGSRLGRRQLLGTLLGLTGTIVLLTGGRLHASAGHLLGDGLAIAAAVVWALYSLLSRRLPSFPSASVGGFCLVAGCAALVIVSMRHGLTPGLASLRPQDWWFLVAMGIGPLGVSFYCWDAAMKHGDATVIAALAYLTPLLSTLGLILCAGQHLHAATAVGLATIFAGAVIGSWTTVTADGPTRLPES